METLKIFEVIPEHTDVKFMLNLNENKARCDFDYYLSENNLNINYEFKIVHDFNSNDDILGLKYHHKLYGRYKDFNLENFIMNFDSGEKLEYIINLFNKDFCLQNYIDDLEEKILYKKERIEKDQKSLLNLEKELKELYEKI